MRRLPKRGPIAIVAMIAIVASLGCGGDDGGTPDAGGEQSTLDVLTPPGDSIGLAFSAPIELRVRYLDPSGQPVSGVGITFELVAGASEDVGASTLSASSAGTGDDGIARANLTAGPREANFRVRATAPNAAPALFFVVVSDTGFADFRVTTTHQGARPAADYGNLELRLFSPSTVRCAGLDIDALPDSVLPPRTTGAIGEAARFTNLAANRPYTLVVWGENTPGSTRLGVGCVELEAAQVAVGPELMLTITVADRALLWPAAVPVASALLLPDLAAQVDAAIAPDPWPLLACPLGAAQLVIDCGLDAAFDDGTLDCVVGASDSLIDDIEALRAPADLAGCRDAEVTPGTPSLDQTLADRMTAGPFTLAGATSLADAQEQLLTGLSIDSELVVTSPTSAEHRLRGLRQVVGGLSHEVDLAASSRAVTSAALVSSIDGAGIFHLATHGFTLDLERALRAAFETVHLPAHGLDGRIEDLGAALVESFEDGGLTGCEAISDHVCVSAGAPSTCIEVACQAAATTLDGRLLQWTTETAAAGLDFRLQGSAAVADTDFDRVADQIGGGLANRTGAWTIEIETASGAVAGVGAFGGAL